MDCPSCSEVIPDDSIFCPECGARQNLSRASSDFAQALGGGIAAPTSSGVVSGEAVRQQRESGMEGDMPSDLLSQIAQGIGGDQQPTGGTVADSQISDMPNNNPHKLQSMSGVSQSTPANTMSGVDPVSPLDNHSVSPTDEMVNRIAEAEKEVKNERRSQWLQMNHDTAADVLGSISGELPSHLQNQEQDPAQALMQQTMGGGGEEGPAPSLLRRMSEVAVRRVARKRGVAVETPQIKPEGDNLSVNVTFIDDGRVLDGPSELANAFQHAISTELALKGIDMSTEVTLFRSKDGEIERVHGRGPSESEDDEEKEDMFACEICSGLVKESDNKCPHCGAEFAEDEEDEPSPAKSGPPGRGRGPPGRGSGGPGGPSRGPPGGGGGPGGPSRGPPGKGGGGGPGGPKKRGPPGGGSDGGSKRGPPGGGPGGGSKRGPPGGGPGGPSRGPPGKGGSGGPKRGGPPGGPKRGPPGGPKRKGPPR